MPKLLREASVLAACYARFFLPVGMRSNAVYLDHMIERRRERLFPGYVEFKTTTFGNSLLVLRYVLQALLQALFGVELHSIVMYYAS